MVRTRLVFAKTVTYHIVFFPILLIVVSQGLVWPALGCTGPQSLAYALLIEQDVPYL